MCSVHTTVAAGACRDRQHVHIVPCSRSAVIAAFLPDKFPPLPTCMQVRVNWAAQREQKVDTTSHFHIFVGDLAPEINDRALLEAFSVIPSCSDARVVWDHTTGRCTEAPLAHPSASKPALMLRCFAAASAWPGVERMQSLVHVACPAAAAAPATVTIDLSAWHAGRPPTPPPAGSSCPRVNRQRFRCRSKGYGFVSYSTREGAERAIREIGGTQIGSRVVRCGWAHHKRDTLQGADYLTIDQVRGVWL